MNKKIKKLAIFFIVVVLQSFIVQAILNAETQKRIVSQGKYQLTGNGIGQKYEIKSGNNVLLGLKVNRWEIAEENSGKMFRAYSLGMEDAEIGEMYQAEILNNMGFFKEENDMQIIARLIQYSEQELKKLSRIKDRENWVLATQLVIWSIVHGESTLGLENFKYEENWRIGDGETNRLFFHKTVDAQKQNILLDRFGKDQKLVIEGIYYPYWAADPTLLYQREITLEKFIKEGIDLRNDIPLDYRILINGKVRVPKISVNTISGNYFVKADILTPLYYEELKQKVEELRTEEIKRKLGKSLVIEEIEIEEKENDIIRIEGIIRTENLRHLVSEAEAENVKFGIEVDGQTVMAEKYEMQIDYQQYNRWKFVVQLKKELGERNGEENRQIRFSAELITVADGEREVVGLFDQDTNHSLIMTSEIEVGEVLRGDIVSEIVFAEHSEKKEAKEEVEKEAKEEVEEEAKKEAEKEAKKEAEEEAKKEVEKEAKEEAKEEAEKEAKEEAEKEAKEEAEEGAKEEAEKEAKEEAEKEVKEEVEKEAKEEAEEEAKEEAEEEAKEEAEKEVKEEVEKEVKEEAEEEAKEEVGEEEDIFDSFKEIYPIKGREEADWKMMEETKEEPETQNEENLEQAIYIKTWFPLREETAREEKITELIEDFVENEAMRIKSEEKERQDTLNEEKTIYLSRENAEQMEVKKIVEEKEMHTSITELPKTGGISLAVWMVFGIGSMLAGIYLKKRNG